MNMTVYSMGIDDLTVQANQVKEAVLFALERDGLLNKPAKDLSEQYAVVISKPGWLGALFQKIRGRDEKDALNIDVMKAV